MGGLKLSVHPLFYAFGFYYALTGRILTFVIYTVCAVIHEIGHSIAAANSGYRLDRITLMPFGAVVKGDIDGLKLKDEIKIALAGPIVNLAIGLFFIASWWIYPELYAFTDTVCLANLSLALVNLIPVFPLDGGRVLSAVIALKWGNKVSGRVCKITAVVMAAALFAAFIYSAFSSINFSLLFFTLFVCVGAFGKAKDNKYVKLYTSLWTKNLKRGATVKRQAVDKNVTVKKVMSLLDETAVNEIDVYEDGKKRATLNPNEISKIIEKADLYAKIGEFI